MSGHRRRHKDGGSSRSLSTAPPPPPPGEDAVEINEYGYAVLPRISLRRHLKKGGKEAHADFELQDVLGKGSFGSVYKVRGCQLPTAALRFAVVVSFVARCLALLCFRLF